MPSAKRTAEIDARLSELEAEQDAANTKHGQETDAFNANDIDADTYKALKTVHAQETSRRNQERVLLEQERSET